MNLLLHNYCVHPFFLLKRKQLLQLNCEPANHVFFCKKSRYIVILCGAHTQALQQRGFLQSGEYVGGFDKISKVSRTIDSQGNILSWHDHSHPKSLTFCLCKLQQLLCVSFIYSPIPIRRYCNLYNEVFIQTIKGQIFDIASSCHRLAGQFHLQQNH